MMEKETLLHKITRGLELEDALLPDQSIIEIAGERRILIENHLGVNAYGPERISVTVKFGTVEICGKGLELARMTREQLVIAGEINSITLYRRVGR